VSPDKKKIVVAGKSYASVEEMPAEVRRVYERAVETRNQEHADARVKLVFNGQEYDSLDSMPPEVRKLYQTQQVAMETYRDFSVDATTPRVAKAGEAGMDLQRKSFFAEHKWPLIGVGLLVVVLIIIIILT
jgi:hypothetical protein